MQGRYRHIASSCPPRASGLSSRMRRKNCPRSQAEDRRSRDYKNGRKVMWCRIMNFAALSTTAFWLMSGVAHADQTVIKFWDNQQTESGLSTYQQEAVKRFEAENPDIRVE